MLPMRFVFLCILPIVLPATIVSSAGAAVAAESDSPRPAVTVNDAASLASAVRDQPEGTIIEIAPGEYRLEATLELKAGTTLKGAGIDKTILTHADSWRPSTAALPDPEMRLEGLNTDAYLIRIKRDTKGVVISDLTLRAPQLHGAIFSWFHEGLHLHHVRIKGTLWSGLRTFGMKQAKIHDCEFIDAGGRWERGKPGTKGGITGGGIFACWMSDCEVFNNRFIRTHQAPEREFYGIKVREAKRCRVHHNTIETNFSIEMPFENDQDVEIDHNVLFGTVSIPKHSGGPVPKSGRTFFIHHNWFRDSYSIEFVRNGVEISHNLFDFDPQKDHGNLISGFGKAPAPGPAEFHNNLVNNPGRGVIWINEPYNNLVVRNNHIIARPTATPRKDGLFGLNPQSDMKTISIRDNIIECLELPRPLFRNAESYSARVENNQLKGVSDADKLGNAPADRPAGPEAPLKFTCGAYDEFIVDQWQVRPTRAGSNDGSR